MKKILSCLLLFISLIQNNSCNNKTETIKDSKNPMGENLKQGNFLYDLNFLKNHQEIVILSGKDEQAQVVICPGWQARVMTSSAEGLKGISFGWINYELIETKTFQPHINVFGGEDRFWLGPEGGQYSIFFKKGSPFDIEHWQTPASLDTEAFTINEKQKDRASFTKKMELENYQGTRFHLSVNRGIRILSNKEIETELKISLGSLKSVAFQTENTITNTGESAWEKSSGLLSIWILGMFPASPQTKVLIPYKGTSKEKVVNDDYFGKLSDKKLSIKNNIIYFLADGKYRSKIGITQEKALPILGSYDQDKRVLTIIKYSLPDKPHDYVNSLWQIQKYPYKGDVVNAYNDGPLTAETKGMGSFYEMETSSPAADLKPGESLSHLHKTFHFYGDEKELNEISKKLLKVSVAEIKNKF